MPDQGAIITAREIGGDAIDNLGSRDDISWKEAKKILCNPCSVLIQIPEPVERKAVTPTFFQLAKRIAHLSVISGVVATSYQTVKREGRNLAQQDGESADVDPRCTDLAGEHAFRV